MKTRKAVYAGTWYPERAKACEAEIVSFLSGPQPATPDESPVLGGIVPHAGWYFSGKIACQVIEAIFRRDPKPDVAVIFGMHLPPQSEPFIMAQGSWETPLGPLKIAESLSDQLIKRFKFVVETEQRFISDNTIELQLPFIRYFSNHTKILPIGAPPAALSLEIARAVVEEAAALNSTIAVIGSTDLTHYGPNYGFTPFGTGDKALKWVREVNDPAIIREMRAMDPERVIHASLESHSACCGGAAAAAIAALNLLGATRSERIAYATSHEKSPGHSFVGYGGLIFR